MLDENMSKRLGNEKLTRPEEISALSKYLKHIKEVQEEHTELEQDNLELFGRETGKLVETESLESFLDSLDAEDKVEKLENKKESITDDRDFLLENTSEKLVVDKPVKLDNSLESLHVDKKVGLDSTKELLGDKGIKDIKLSNFKEALSNGQKDIKLSEFIERFGGNLKELKLDNTKEILSVDENNKLSTVKEKLQVENEISLSNTLETIFVEDKIKLSDTKEKLSGNIISPDLSKFIEKLGKDINELSLSEFIEKLSDERDLSLSDVIIGLGGSLKDLELSDFIERLFIASNLSLEDFVSKLIGTPKDVSLYKNLLSKNKLSDTEIIDSLEDCSEEIKSQLKMIKEGESIGEDAYLETAFKIIDDQPWLSEDWKEKLRISFSENYNSALSYKGYNQNPKWIGPNPNKSAENTADYLADLMERLYRETTNEMKVSDSEAAKEARQKQQDKYKEDYGISSAIYWQRDGNIEHRIPNTGLPDWTNWGTGYSVADPLGTASKVLDQVSNKLSFGRYLRYAAEQAASQRAMNGETRKYIIDEMLFALVKARDYAERLGRITRSRLPGGNELLNTAANLLNSGGSNLKSELKSLAKTNMEAMFNKEAFKKEKPINRPKKDTDGSGSYQIADTVKAAFDEHSITFDTIREKDGATYFGGLSKEPGQLPGITSGTFIGIKSRKTPLNVPDVDNGKGGGEEFETTGSRDFKAPGNKIYSFKDNYLSGNGILVTMAELCNRDVNSVKTVNDLFDSLKNGEYITTPSKFGALDLNKYKVSTIDTNAYWEIVMEPYVGELNGFFSYLPSFKEMDVINKRNHGVTTVHGKWIPFTGFELSKSRLTTKSLGLFDGEIVYPVASELTNELRISISDDEFKSWRWYFQKCQDISVYSSEPHSAEFYELPKPPLTVIDKENHLVAFYKNLAFKIIIYVMTPQYSTLKRYNLLCVLREFTEEFSGETDAAPGNDLSLSFSIVGELKPSEVANNNPIAMVSTRKFREFNLDSTENPTEESSVSDKKKKRQEKKAERAKKREAKKSSSSIVGK